MSQYKIVVEFSRETSDDRDVIQSRKTDGKDGGAWKHGPMTPTDELRQQFIDELQAAYDCPSCGLAGHFKVLSIEVPVERLTDVEVRRMIISLLDDDDGVSENSYEWISRMAESTGNGDLLKRVKATDGRFYLSGEKE